MAFVTGLRVLAAIPGHPDFLLRGLRITLLAAGIGAVIGLVYSAVMTVAGRQGPS
jgi:hypothetical protein